MTNLTKNIDKSKNVDSACEIAFDEAGSCSFGNNFTRNNVNFCVDNSSLSYTDNRKNNLLVLCE